MASAASADTKEEIVKALSDAYDFGTAVLNAQTPENINLLLNKDIFSLAAPRAGESCGRCCRTPRISMGRWWCTCA
jgi:hypothetical protein